MITMVDAVLVLCALVLCVLLSLHIYENNVAARNAIPDYLVLVLASGAVVLKLMQWVTPWL